jgi:5-methylcytosine-specific restriction endonuclease McrA
MCSTHYNQAMPKENRHAKTDVPCVICGKAVRRSRDPRYQPTCSVACRSLVQWGHTAASGAWDWAEDAVKRAREAGVTVVESFDRLEIFERDSWTCQLCGVRCTPPDPYVLTSATVDHIVPFARAGEHSRANAQTACLSCNSSKQAADLTAA